MLKILNEDLDIKKIADSGQCFRMFEREEGKWQFAAGSKLTDALVLPSSEVIIDCPSNDDSFWHEYFDLDTDYKGYRNSVDPDDSFLSAAVSYGKGIRILRQDPWEMLITFIISQRRSIPSIKTCVERICRKWGDPLANDIYSFPEPSQLAKASLEELSECSLGYRAEYVYLAAKAVYSGELDLESLKGSGDNELMETLLSLRGVGVKVANCVSLFGFHRIAAFPVDVWIDRVQKEYYGGRFPVEKYDGYAGIMQQYIFYYARKR